MRSVAGIIATRKNYVFQNASAQAYWNALSTANGGAEVSASLYGITSTALKQAIDNCFAGLNTDGLLSKISKWCPCIGGTSATHAINAISPGTKNSTYSGSPTHGANGVTLSGSNWEDFIVVPSTDMSQNDWTMGCLAHDDYTPAATITLFGAQESGALGILKLRIDLVTSQVQAFPGDAAVNILFSHGGSNKGLWSMIRRTSTATRLHKNGSQVGTGSISSTSLTDDEIVMGGLNSNGSKTGSYVGTIRHSFVSTQFSDTESTNFKNRIKTLDTVLNRNIIS